MASAVLVRGRRDPPLLHPNSLCSLSCSMAGWQRAVRLDSTRLLPPSLSMQVWPGRRPPRGGHWHPRGHQACLVLPPRDHQRPRPPAVRAEASAVLGGGLPPCCCCCTPVPLQRSKTGLSWETGEPSLVGWWWNGASAAL